MECTPSSFNSVELCKNNGISLNKRPPLWSAIPLQMLQFLRGSLGGWVPGGQHTLLRGQRGQRGQRGREQSHGLRCLALVAECSGE